MTSPPATPAAVAPPAAPSAGQPDPGSSRAILAVLAVWSVAFGYVEGAVVVYLREIYYRGGFRFPLVAISDRIARVEAVREAATIVLLWGVAHLSAREGLRRFGAFLFCFGIWDLIYYLTLKVTLGWPTSWLEPDILFLLPAPWIAPVLAPMLAAAAMVVAGGLVVGHPDGSRLRMNRFDWAIEIAAGLIILTSFLWSAGTVVRGGAPRGFPWALFAVGFILGAGWFARMWMVRARTESDRIRGSAPAAR